MRQNRLGPAVPPQDGLAPAKREAADRDTKKKEADQSLTSCPQQTEEGEQEADCETNNKTTERRKQAERQTHRMETEGQRIRETERQVVRHIERRS